ncbi:MAG: hypothetical protein ABSA80_07600 [Terriglobales bacterium]|jgi:hypothetical protein
MNQAEKVASHIRKLGFAIVSPTGYGHMGATLTDAVLQAGVTWKTTVLPRAERVRTNYPNASTTSGFARLVVELGPEAVLDWHGRKPRMLLELLVVLLQHNIETEDQLPTWLEQPANRELLRQIKGIKDKTANYLARDVAVDRHLFDFVAEAGAPTDRFSEAHQIIRDAAELLGIEPATLDYSIWLYMSERAARASVKRCKTRQGR